LCKVSQRADREEKEKKMFRKNTTHLQTSFFDIENQLSESKKKKIKESEEYSFYQLIFKKIKEEDFEVILKPLQLFLEEL